MDDDDNTTFYVTFKDTTHNLGVIDPDKLSRQSWERKKVQIVDDHDLIVQLHEHHNRLCYHMQLYLDEIHSVTESTTKRALFQTSEDITSAAPKTSIPVITDQNNLMSNVPPTSISANSDLFEDFMDIYFRSSTGQQTKSTRTELTASTYDFDDSDYCLTESEEEDPYHPRGAANLINSLALPIDQANEGYIHSDDSDVDCILSNCDSDDNEFDEDSNN
ncbi:hypothetical protein WN944_018278 [Citrus x changshan-huyou]|uniref:Uncharacterized protein n=1 Tax=Citrus x changshan-huyou TaxID=2935761 RepID=A0AAP0QFA6_9ROSI